MPHTKVTPFSKLQELAKHVQPPLAKREDHEHECEFEKRKDPFFWLRDDERESEEVLDYLRKENEFLDKLMEPVNHIKEELFNEMKGRMREDDESPPAKQGPYMYYERVVKGQQYKIYCRKKIGDEAEEVLLDVNELAKGHDFTRIGVLETSPDHSMVAYSVDHSGDEKYFLYIKDLKTGEIIEKEPAQNTSYSVAWGNDNRTVFYDVMDETTLRQFRIMRHVLGTSHSEDVCIFEDSDELYNVDVGKTLDDAFIVIKSESKTTSECLLISADSPLSAPVCFAPRRQGVEYSLVHRLVTKSDGSSVHRFYIHNNDNGATNFKIDMVDIPTSAFEASAPQPSKEAGLAPPSTWKELIPHSPDTRISDVDAFSKYLVMELRSKGSLLIKIREVSETEQGCDEHAVAFPEDVGTCWVGANYEFDTDTIRLGFTSLITPSTTYDYHVPTRTLKMIKENTPRTPEGYEPYDKSVFTTYRSWATGHDGAQIPVTVVHKKGIKLDSSHPLLIYGYGSYEISIDPSFSASDLSLLDRGFVYAIAHIRGGGEMGRPWYEDGKFLKKKNTFHDFVSVTRHLHAQGYSNPNRTVAMGGSAGGLLMGAVMNMAPHLYEAMIAEVPFVDVVSTMSDPDLPLTVQEYEEWGCPEEEEYYHYMKAYSPYDNLCMTVEEAASRHTEAHHTRHLPHMMLTGGLNDTRVGYWEPAKFCAKLRIAQTEGKVAPNRAVVMKMELGAGHGGKSGRYEALDELALQYAFLLSVVSHE